MNATDRAYVDSQRAPLLRELVRLDAEEDVVRERLEQWSVRLAEIRARRREIDGELLDVDSRFREGAELRKRMRAS